MACHEPELGLDLDQDSPGRRLDHGGSSAGWAHELLTVRGALHLLAQGMSPDQITALHPDLPDEWLAYALAVAVDALDQEDLAHFTLDAELDQMSGSVTETVTSFAGLGLEPTAITDWLTTRIECFPRPTVVTLEPIDHMADPVYVQLIHTPVGVVSETAGRPAPGPKVRPSLDTRIAMADLGWHLPDTEAGEPNFWRDDIGPGHLRSVVRRAIDTLLRVHGVEPTAAIRISFHTTEMYYEVVDHPSGRRILPGAPRPRSTEDDAALD